MYIQASHSPLSTDIVLAHCPIKHKLWFQNIMVLAYPIKYSVLPRNYGSHISWYVHTHTIQCSPQKLWFTYFLVCACPTQYSVLPTNYGSKISWYLHTIKYSVLLRNYGSHISWLTCMPHTIYSVLPRNYGSKISWYMYLLTGSQEIYLDNKSNAKFIVPIKDLKVKKQ